MKAANKCMAYISLLIVKIARTHRTTVKLYKQKLLNLLYICDACDLEGVLHKLTLKYCPSSFEFYSICVLQLISLCFLLFRCCPAIDFPNTNQHAEPHCLLCARTRAFRFKCIQSCITRNKNWFNFASIAINSAGSKKQFKSN